MPEGEDNGNNGCMKLISCLFLGILSAFALSACGSSPDENAAAGLQLSTVAPAAGGPLLPLPGEIPAHDPDDGLFMEAISVWLKKNDAPENSQYQFTRIDLDGDGRRDGLVLLQSPHQSWCMEYGCTMFIFQAHDEGFSYLSEVSPVRGPLVVMNTKSNGWRDIAAYVSGRSGWDAKNVMLKFDGTAYPQQPALQTASAVNFLETDGIKIFP